MGQDTGSGVGISPPRGAVLDASHMARFAPSPANGDIRYAASPTRVTPGTRSQRWPIGRAWIRRGPVGEVDMGAAVGLPVAHDAGVAGEREQHAPAHRLRLALLFD